ncbi:MAG: tRNA-specific adenosine deaminase [Micavibrio aeruginosavorus]|uniref:tRNA-specific adenosine deaminase n=1 Tax=Micavibrio aeruginosavorus TaxID=349221 RepID=A0A2W5HCZ9_9BACT|nr:MAG: tRNA-specific adenosine deaminase [Micavibrio aeruginosavorus]
MQEALLEAQKAALRDEVPIGAVLVDSRTGEIVARASNMTIEHSDPTSHAEILVIRQICKNLGVQRLPEYDLYITLEPCPMCAAAISFARIRKLVFGASDPKSGGVLSGPALYTHSQLHHKPQVEHGLMAEESSAILKDFFKLKRS